MKAIVVEAPDRLKVQDVPAPPLGDHEVRIRIRAAGVNRADILQSQGLYPPPPGASNILGLECMGEIIEVGAHAAPWRGGERVMALLTGGGYAQEAVAHSSGVMAVPSHFSDEEAAAFPVTFLTSFVTIFILGAVPEHGTVLVHGGGSGVGTAAIRLCKAAGIRIIVTAGTDKKCALCRELGADVAIHYKDAPWPEVVRQHTDQQGVNVVVDCVGGAYLDDNLKSLAVDGRLVIIGLIKGHQAPINLATLLSRRLQVIGTTLRGGSGETKAKLIEQFYQRFNQALSKGQLQPVIDRIFPLEDAQKAHDYMQSNQHFGKIILRTTAF